MRELYKLAYRQVRIGFYNHLGYPDYGVPVPYWIFTIANQHKADSYKRDNIGQAYRDTLQAKRFRQLLAKTLQD